MVQFAGEARAQCAARDVLQNQIKHNKAHFVHAPQQIITSVRDVPVWRTIETGTFSSAFALRNALDAMRCSVGGQAAEILARPAFTTRSKRTAVDLVVVSPAELGFITETTPLASIYARARQLGLELAAAEIGPQLRIQYFDQPMGEFLILAMEPIRTWSGEPMILNVANGGAGLILIAQDGRGEAEIPVTSRLVFARPSDAALGRVLIEEAAALLPP